MCNKIGLKDWKIDQKENYAFNINITGKEHILELDSKLEQQQMNGYSNVILNSICINELHLLQQEYVEEKNMQDKISAYAHEMKCYYGIGMKYNDLMQKYEDAKDKYVQFMIHYNEVEKNFDISKYKLQIWERNENKKSYEEQKIGYGVRKSNLKIITRRCLIQ